mmetsp:Transcript_111255/g.338299  ORF Transcript_111255/g.338299 Transcript_111255/m.338299 type:complete len:175 (+) Transcript_111255:1-525(+)
MAKRSVKSAPLEAANAAWHSRGVCKVAMVTRSPKTPRDSSDSEMDKDEPLLATEFYKESSALAAKRKAEIAFISKRIRVDKEERRPEQADGDSQASTASSTPATTPAASPMLAPVAVDTWRVGALGGSVDYRTLSEPELRDELGGLGTSITNDWNRDELIAVLEQMDRIADLEL